MTLDIAVGGDGKVTGTGTGSLAATAQCSGPGFLSDYLSRQAHKVSFSVSGDKTDKMFELQFAETSIDGATAGLINYALLLQSAHVILDVPLTGLTTAEVQTTVERTLDTGSVSAQHKVKMTCKSCK